MIRLRRMGTALGLLALLAVAITMIWREAARRAVRSEESPLTVLGPLGRAGDHLPAPRRRPLSAGRIRELEALAARGTGAIADGGNGYEPSLEDRAWTAIFEDAFREHLEHGFYVRVAGTSHRNSDGTSRMRIAGECEPAERLHLAHEPQNPYHDKAVRVLRANGEQLGYLPWRTAEEVCGSIMRHGYNWLAFFRRVGHDPETGHPMGAVILLLCLVPDERRELRIEPPGDEVPILPRLGGETDHEFLERKLTARRAASLPVTRAGNVGGLEREG